MSEASPGKLLLTLLRAWNEPDSGARDTILDEAVAASFLYEDPHAPAPFEGRDGMAQYLSIFRQNLPDAELHPVEAPKVTHGTALVSARLDRSGRKFARLIFIGQADAGALTRVTGFVESE
ncbi:hypothetical protein JANAI62_17110 [Jannaschia pagri]|uniref:SnoaL-like domain-containing protein n=1 Tax=Jannaschia pagri TaxID=2829797 RepID=A0ABQ4NKZ1_9RHOB|nr:MULTISPECIES: hypothetical protein [unclassified Jannaschia]GIT91255.1 hypothetical protein JANAI61_17130 [Jannaschia sp. AI_61]GIT95088.1 hypothetical protein JANAI62_17110 [Jannaschia sp. AI_62]